MRTLLNGLAAGTLVALVFLALSWELSLAPLRPGGSWLVLKALPLLLPLRGVLAGRLHTYRWAVILVLAYFAEGVVRAWAEDPPGAYLALTQSVLALAFFVSGIAFVRVTSAETATGSR